MRAVFEAMLAVLVAMSAVLIAVCGSRPAPGRIGVQSVSATAQRRSRVWPAVRSTIEKCDLPPDAESLISIAQSFAGKPAEVLVSLKKIRVLFSFRMMVSKPKFSLLTQSNPTQVLPWTMRSSAIT